MADDSNASLPIYDVSGEKPVLGSLPHEEVHDAIASGKYSLPKGSTIHAFDPDGNLGELPAEEAHAALSGGYTYATPSAIDDYKNSSLSEQLKAGAEGVGEGIAGPLAPLAERAVGVDPEDIRRRSHTIAHGVGQAAGLIGGTLTGTGEAALLEGAGKLAAEGMGLAQPVSYAARVGSEAVKQAAEMAVMSSGDEASKLILNDPEASATNALVNVGLSSALGAGGGALFAGAVSPLWKASGAGKLADWMGELVGVRGGIEGAQSEAERLVQETGVMLPDAVAAKVNGSNLANLNDSVLSQTDHTIAGRAYQEQREQVFNGMREASANALGVDPAYVEGVGDLNRYESGKNISDTFVKSQKASVDAMSDEYEKITNKLQKAQVTKDNLEMMGDKIAKISLDQQWGKSMSPEVRGFFDEVMKSLAQREDANDLKLMITDLRKTNPYGKDTYSMARDIRKVLDDGLEKAHVDHILSTGASAAEAAQSVAGYKALKQSYAAKSSLYEDLDHHLHVGDWGSPKSFLKALSEKAETNGETMLERFAGNNRAQMLDLLSQHSPETLEAVKNYHLDRLIKSAKDTGGDLNVNKLLKNAYDEKKFSPQVRSLVMSQQGEQRLKAIGELSERLKDPTFNASKTARTIAKSTSPITTAMQAVAALSGHAGGAILGGALKAGLDEGMDAGRLGILNMLGSTKGISSSGLKASVKFISQSMKGETMAAKAVGAVFKRGSQVLIDSAVPNATHREKLDKIVDQYQNNPAEFQARLQGEDLGHYMPGHQTALTQQAAQSVQYLAALKPKPFKPGPLDLPIEPSKQQTQRYNRALDIAQQPLVVLQHVKDGTLQTTDLTDLHTMYPGYANNLIQKLSNEMANSAHNEEPIPYKTRMGLSMFLGQAVDQSMSPQGIMAAQASQMQQASPPPQQGPVGKKPSDKTGTMMGKGAKSYQTASQSAESDRGSRES